MRPLDRRQIAASIATFAAILIVGGWPWARMPLGFSRAYSPVVNALVLNHLTFGNGGHARLDPLPQVNQDDTVATDSELTLTIDARAGHLKHRISLWRDAYLPLLIVAGLIVAAPLERKRKAVRLPLGICAMGLLTVGALCLLTLWSFSFNVTGVYPPSPFRQAAVDLAFRALLLPPGNRFIEPMAIGFALVWWRRRPGHR